jgi:single-strand DNA-binding protein
MEAAGKSRATARGGAALAAVSSNEVRLRGRVAAAPEERELPSGDRIMQLRVVVPRDLTARRREKSGSGLAPGSRVQTVDTIDLVCWTATTRRTAGRLTAGQTVEVRGALRRRFFGGPQGRQSRYEVEVATLRRVSDALPADT